MSNTMSNAWVARMNNWAQDKPAFEEGQWVRYNGTAYEVTDVQFIQGAFHYYLNDGSNMPHHEDSLRAV